MKKTIRDFSLQNKIVILRCDLNVSINDGKITDDTRIRESLDTIKYILENKGKVVILSHLGKIKTEDDKIKNDLKIVCKRLNKYLNNKITFVNKTVDKSIKDKLDNIPFGEGIMLQNTRYEDLNGERESKCDLELAKYWASLGDIFINDAFGTIHRKHASNYGISKYLDSGIGFLVEKEIRELSKLDKPKRPFAVIMGGSKVSDKLEVINSLVKKVDYLFIGGAMAFTFLKSMDIEVGKSLVEDDHLDYCKNLLEKYPKKIILPIDFIGSNKFSNESRITIQNIMNIDKDFIGMDIGPKTILTYKNELIDINTIFWNGPLGVYEFSNYQNGTNEILNSIINTVPTTIIGGGDIISCASKAKCLDKLTFVSTGGGATLAYLTSKNLPGLKNIKEV